MSEIFVTVIDGAGHPQFTASAASMESAAVQFGRVAPGKPPTDRHRWTGSMWDQKAPNDVLPAARSSALERIKAARDRLGIGTFTTEGRTYNCNREAINTAAVGAMLAKASLDLTWTKTWTLADNTSATLTADQVLAVARACDDYITALWATGRTLRAQIEAAATVAAVDAINWP